MSEETPQTKHRALIKEWSIVKMFESHVIVGFIYGDVTGQYKDGKAIRTSVVKSIDFTTGRAETLNSIYLLSGVR